MSLSVSSLIGVAALAGGVAAGLSALIVGAVAWLVAVGLVNAIGLLGELVDAIDDGAGPLGDGASRLRPPSGG